MLIRWPPMNGPDHPPREGVTLFSVKADRKRFPAELWHRFKATTEARGERWIDALRRLVERYIAEHKEPKP